MRNKYFYRFDLTSELGKSFKKFQRDCADANRAAEIWAEKAHAKAYYSSPSGFAGGVTCVSFGDMVPDDRLWKNIGKDQNGELQYEPLCSSRTGVALLPRKEFMPSDTKTKIYSKRICTWKEVKRMLPIQEWAAIAGTKLTDDKDADMAAIEKCLGDEYFMQYVELYREDYEEKRKTAQKKRRMTNLQLTAIELERTRLLLPLVTTERLYALMQAEEEIPEEKKATVIEEVTPIFFKTLKHVYIALCHPCKHPSLEKISKIDFQLRLEKVTGNKE